ncbi:MAG: deoxyribodipyrimidine photo-lyase [Gammaproteobacteria bacterium]|jgi:deoxyribodipyrimidine photo-lyase|nr:deoxyribodipyrimidine photo-lyase [Gammaproteobacteria bacterium]
MQQGLNILWFEQDLRLADNLALTAAIAQGKVLAIYILDQHNTGAHSMGAASRWWLHHSLQALDTDLGGKLNFYQGDPHTIINQLRQRLSIAGVYWNRRYEPWRIQRDKHIKQQLSSQGITAKSYKSSLLHEPWTICNKEGNPYQVFTPYHRQASLLDDDMAPLPAPNLTTGLEVDSQAGKLPDFMLLPKVAWDSQFYKCWKPGERGACDALNRFLANGISQYQKGRDWPASNAVSKLSPHLHFGELSPRQTMQSLLRIANDNNSEHFKREIRWREFAYYLLYYWPHLPSRNLRVSFDQFPWHNQADCLTRWQQGRTGYPLVDAGMRELWQTGYMHNRVRMITASFLVKNLLIDWRLGWQWFWDCLVDADLASNSASWQWVAGCGADAAPYFRIFNPITQGEKFDPQGAYTRRYIPELQDLPDKYLYKPWQAPEGVLRQAKVELGQTYPLPMVDINTSRQAALAAYALLKKGN